LLRRGLPALLLVVSSTAALSASTGIVQAVEQCRLEPGVAAPSGSKWLYRVNRDHLRCWFLTSSGGHRAQARRSASVRNRHIAPDTAGGQQHQQRNNDLQIASAPTSTSDVAMTAEQPAVSQAVTRSVEQSSENLIPRSVPTIDYRVLSPSTPTVSGPASVAARGAQPAPASTSNSNVVLLAGAAAGLLFAGGVFYFTRRGLMRSSKRALAKRHGVIVARSTITHPPAVTTNWAEDLRLKLGELNRDRPSAPKAGNMPLSHQRDAVALPHAAARLKRPKAKPTKEQTSRQLADA
jgi:hypothetical protein